LTPPLSPEESKDERLRELHEAHDSIRAWMTNRQMTNYESFEVEAAALQTDQAMFAMKRFNQAEKMVRDAAQYSEAIRLFDEGFGAWKQVLVSRQDCRNRQAADPSFAIQRCRDFRDLDRHQENAYEMNVRYVKLAQDVRQRELREATLLLSDLVSHGGTGHFRSPLQFACDLTVLASEAERPRLKPDDPVQIEARVPQLKSVTVFPLPGPLDGLAPDGTPWISESVKTRVQERLGLIRRPQGPPGPGGPDAAPATAPLPPGQ
jgi:hypothetical protein